MAAVVYDLENVLIDVLSVLTTKLNTKIAAIDAEKTANGQQLTPALSQIDANAFYAQTFINKILNFSPFVYYGIEEVKPVTSGQVTAENVKVWVTIGVLDNGQFNDAYRRVLRYIRALKEIFQENFSALGGASKIKIETLAPVSFKLDENSSEEFKIGGVSLLVGLA